jgi:DNA invertase Pin-like site-specific DNA recombinase
LDGPAAEVILAVMAWAAKMERLAINERIAAARRRVEVEKRALGQAAHDGRRAGQASGGVAPEGKTVRAIAAAPGVSRATVGLALAG